MYDIPDSFISVEPRSASIGNSATVRRLQRLSHPVLFVALVPSRWRVGFRERFFERVNDFRVWLFFFACVQWNV
jgi:hypothetical protein